MLVPVKQHEILVAHFLNRTVPSMVLSEYQFFVNMLIELLFFISIVKFPY